MGTPSLPVYGSLVLPRVLTSRLSVPSESSQSHHNLAQCAYILLGPSITSSLRELSFVEDLIGLRNAQELVRLTIRCDGEDVSRES